MKIHRKHPNKFILVLIWMLFFVTPITAQIRDSLKTIIKSSIPESERIIKINTFLNRIEVPNNDSLHYLYQDYAYWLFDINKKEEAILYEKKALAFSTANHKFAKDFIQKSNYYLGFYYYRNNELLKSIDPFKEVITLNNKNSLALKAYQRLGLVHLKIHDYYQAVNYFELVSSILEKDNSRLKLLRNAYQNIVNVCLRIKTIDGLKKGQLYARKADSLANLIPTSQLIKYRIKISSARLYNQNETLDVKTSLNYYQSALEIAKEMKDTSRIRYSYMGMGNLLNETDNKKSTNYLRTALDITKKKDSFMLYQIYINLGYNFQVVNDFESALEHNFKGLKYLTARDFKNYESIDNEFLIDFPYKKNLLISLPQLAETYLKYYEANPNDHSLLDKSIAYFKISDHIIDLLKLNSSEFNSRLFWREISTRIYGKAIKACYASNNLEEAFYFMEKNKALLLMEDLAHQRYRQSLALPALYLSIEDSIQKLIYKKEQLLKSNQGLSNDKKGNILKERMDLKIELSKLRDSELIKVQDFDIEPAILTLLETQSNMASNEVFIQYHISIDDGYGVYSNNKNGYALFVTKDRTYFNEIRNLNNLKVQVEELIKSFKSPFKDSEAKANYTKLANEIYFQLFPSEEIREFIKNRKLIIAPDNYLSLLPFEALSTSEENLNYLILDCQISYLYSYSFLKNTKIKKTKKLSSLGIAPGVFENKTLSSLTNSVREVESLKSHYNGHTFVGKDASKNQFINLLKDHNIIHLATHANAQDSISPWIAFYDESISLEELYLTKNNASLVVLSGCNTTLGKQETGEGVMSLARGFFYSGAESVISSLWSIDDQSTTEIFDHFYKYLSEGKSKSEALHLAKIEYLNTHTLSETSPHFWASLILLGTDNMLPAPSSNVVVYIVIFLLLFLIFFWKRLFALAQK